ncbi:MAG: hypothetical protein B6244_04410 [Candidatus Cloacimonetes bacterium 4572_55]|nr:MAG: hypothetical protein B6244_04410 [Candidatus Cloacimonetes bacterium 4572_55]
MLNRSKSNYRNPSRLKSRFAFLFLCVGLMIVMYSCWQETKNDPLSNKLVVPLTSDPTTYDPVRMWDASSHGRTSALLYNGLTRSDIEGNVIPDLADSILISPNGLVYTFHLKRGVVFSNGQRLTANDVRFSFERLLLESPSSWVLERLVGATEFVSSIRDSSEMEQSQEDSVFVNKKRVRISGIRVIDSYTIELKIQEPFAPFLSLLALPQTYIISKDAVERWGEDYGQNPVGTGPFTLKKWQPDYYLLFERNPLYFGEKPKVESVEFRIIKEELTALAEFELGNLSFLPIPDAEYQRIISDTKRSSHIVSRNMLNSYGLNLNCGKPPFDNVLVRQALNHAIDRQTILERLLNGRGTLAHGVIPPGLGAYNSSAKGYEYNPEKAKELLRQAGYPDGFSFDIWQSTEKSALSICEAFQGYLQEVGIEASIVQNEWSVLKTAVRKGEIDSYYRAWSADYPDAENFLYPIFHSEQPTTANLNFKNKKFDRLIELARATQDPLHRITLYQAAEELIIQEAPWVFFYHGTESWVYQPWVKGLEIPLIFNGDKMNDIQIERNNSFDSDSSIEG